VNDCVLRTMPSELACSENIVGNSGPNVHYCNVRSVRWHFIRNLAEPRIPGEEDGAHVATIEFGAQSTIVKVGRQQKNALNAREYTGYLPVVHDCPFLTVHKLHQDVSHQQQQPSSRNEVCRLRERDKYVSTVRSFEHRRRSRTGQPPDTANKRAKPSIEVTPIGTPCALARARAMSVSKSQF
jgi:hypothetical protein